MSNYRNKRDSRDNFGGTNSRGSVLFSTTCDECGKNCQVPFKPRGDKPVYCSDCFEKKEGGSSRRSYDRYDRGGDRSRGRSGSRDREMFDAVCDKCGKDCKVPFRPSGDKPIYCSECFEEKEAGRGGARRDSRKDSAGGGNVELVSILKSINEKLDKILQAMDKPVVNKQTKGKAVKEIVKGKSVTKKTTKTKKKVVKKKTKPTIKAKKTVKEDKKK